MSIPFKTGDILVVKPHDTNDPDANAQQGKRCEFQRYSAISKEYIVVKFSTKGKPMTFRAADFEKANEELKQ